MARAPKLVVNYVSAPPGTGKTKAAVRCMVKHIRGGLSGSPVGYMFYVVPTITLLHQTMANLRSELDRDEQQMIRSVYAGGGSSSEGGDTTVRKVMSVLDGTAGPKSVGRRFGPGSILFLTHTTFLKIHYHKKLKDTTVIFDESRKWVMKPEALPMTEPVKALFDALFETRPLKVRSVVHDRIQIMRARQIPENKKARLVRYKEQAGRHFQILNTMHEQLKDARTARIEVYAISHGSKLLQIQLPRRPFEGYRRVYVLSADFKTSQMYHLMKMDGCRMLDATVDFIQDHSDGHYADYLAAVQRRYDKLLIVPLLNDKEKPPSKNQYTSGLILPRRQLKNFDHQLREHFDLPASQVRKILSRLRDESSSDLAREDVPPDFEPYLKSIGGTHDVLGWQVKRAIELARRWKARWSCEEPGIMFLNKDWEDELDLGGEFEVLSTGKAEGNNDYLKSNVVCFLAAINPTNAISNLLEALLKHQGYDANEDYVVDKAIQCIGRGNIRDQESTSPMLAVVSNRYIAERVAARMSDRPRVSTKQMVRFGNYVSWDRQVLRSKKSDDQRKTSQRESTDKYRSNPLNRQIERAKDRLRYATKVADPVKINKAQAELQQLLKQRTT